MPSKSIFHAPPKRTPETVRKPIMAIKSAHADIYSQSHPIILNSLFSTHNGLHSSSPLLKIPSPHHHIITIIIQRNPMEEKAKESKAIPTNFLGKSLSSLSSGFLGSLFSSIITLYALILLYFPTHFLEIVFSPVFISTGILLLALLRLGAIQRTVTESELYSVSTPTQEKNLHNPLPEDNKQVIAPAPTKPLSDHGSDLKPYYHDSFREWDVRAPLEVIYEEFAEGEDEDEYEEQQNDGVVDEKTERRAMGTGTYPSLSRYFPESDSDSSSDDGDYASIGNWDSPERAFFKWNEEDREELIEIALDGKRNCGGACGDHVEEENLIEIDIFPARYSVPARC